MNRRRSGLSGFFAVTGWRRQRDRGARSAPVADGTAGPDKVPITAPPLLALALRLVVDDSGAILCRKGAGLRCKHQSAGSSDHFEHPIDRSVSGSVARPRRRQTVPKGRRPCRALDKPARSADISVMTKFSLHMRFLHKAGNTLNRR